MLNTTSHEIEKTINTSTWNNALVNDVIILLELKIAQIDEWVYKENLKLLIEILNKDISRLNYFHVKSLYIVYNLVNKLKKLQTIGEDTIIWLINNLSNSLLEEGFKIDTDFENIIINAIDEDSYHIEEKYIIMYKEKIKEILTNILVNKDDKIDCIVDIKEFLEEKIDENIQILLDWLMTNPIYMARK